MMRAVSLLLGFILLSSLVHAFEIGELREFDTGRFSEYPEISDMKQNVLLSYYSRDKNDLPSGFMEFAGSSLDFMERFGDAYALSSSENASDLLGLPNALKPASDSVARMEGLASDSIPLSKFSAYLARSALDRYVSDQADRLKRLADAEARTKQKLEYYEVAADVFEYSGLKARAAELRAEHDSILASYSLEMEEADKMFLDSKAICDKAISNPGAMFGLESYSNLRKCTGGLALARRTYLSHLENEKLREVNAELASAEEASGKAWGTLVWFFACLMVLFLVLNALVISKLRTWYEDNYDSSLGSEVLRWKGNI